MKSFGKKDLIIKKRGESLKRNLKKRRKSIPTIKKKNDSSFR